MAYPNIRCPMRCFTQRGYVICVPCIPRNRQCDVCYRCPRNHRRYIPSIQQTVSNGIRGCRYNGRNRFLGRHFIRRHLCPIAFLEMAILYHCYYLWSDDCERIVHRPKDGRGRGASAQEGSTTKVERDRLVGTDSVNQWVFFAGILLHVRPLVTLSDVRYSAEAPNGWATWYIIFLLILSLVLLGIFLWVEHKRGARAMMPLKIWKYPQFGLVMVIVFFGWFDFQVVTLYMTFLYRPPNFSLTLDFKMCVAHRQYYAHYTSFPMSSSVLSLRSSWRE
jgi:hypothetical protein